MSNSQEHLSQLMIELFLCHFHFLVCLCLLSQFHWLLLCHFWMHQLCHFLLYLSYFHNDTSVVFFPMSSHLEKGVEPWSRKAWSTFRHARHGSSHCLVFEQTWRQPQFICWQWLTMMQAKKCAFGFARVLWWIKNCRKLHFWEYSFPFGECQMIFCLFCLFTFLTTLLALVFWLSWPWLSWSTTAIFVRVPEVTSAPNVSWMDGLAFWLWQWKWIWRCFGDSTDKLEMSWRAVGDWIGEGKFGQKHSDWFHKFQLSETTKPDKFINHSLLQCLCNSHAQPWWWWQVVLCNIDMDFQGHSRLWWCWNVKIHLLHKWLFESHCICTSPQPISIWPGICNDSAQSPGMHNQASCSFFGRVCNFFLNPSAILHQIQKRPWCSEAVSLTAPCRLSFSYSWSWWSRFGLAVDRFATMRVRWYWYAHPL